MSNLMILLLSPFVMAFAVWLIPVRNKIVPFILSIIPLLILLYGHNTWIGSMINDEMFPALSIRFHEQIDFLSLVFLYITAFIIPFSVIFFNLETARYSKVFYSLVFLLEGFLFGFFTARDLALFTIYWESMLLPIYFMMNIWGHEHRAKAAMKFLIYMIAGSVLMIAATLALYMTAITINGQGTFDFDVLANIISVSKYPGILGAVFLLAFAVKTPLFPFHGWLPDAYCQTSTSGTILLAGLLSKAGIYGFLRIGLQLFPQQIFNWNLVLLGLAVTGVLYGAFAAWRQNDFKRLIAYSSFSHVNFILCGVFAMSEISHAGAILQSINHAITITALFIVIGWLERRVSTTSMNSTGGLAKYLPMLCWTTLFFVLSSVALPGMNNFVGELLIFFGLFGLNPILTAILGTSIIFSVVYMLRFMRKVYFEEAMSHHSKVSDIGYQELLIATPLIIAILWLGIYPESILIQLVEIIK